MTLRLIASPVLPTRGAALDMRDVSIHFADGAGEVVRVLDKARWQIAAGTQVALRGPSGSGKSTLLNLLAGIETPSTGSIQWHETRLDLMTSRGRDAWRHQHLGMVFQQFHLFPGLTALQNVLLPLSFDRLRVAPDAHSRALMLLNEVGVSPGRATALLSRGEQQRVAIARALVSDTQVVLADEPTASLDQVAARLVGELLRRLCRERGATLIVATHDVGEAAQFEEAYALADGRVTRVPSLMPAACEAMEISAA